jgi:hypothetical protein
MGWWPWSKRVRPVVRFIRAKFDSAQTTPDNRSPRRPKADAPAVDSVLTIDPVADMRAKAAAEEERIAAVRKVCGSDHADIAAKGRRGDLGRDADGTGGPACAPAEGPRYPRGGQPAAAGGP